LRPLGWRTSGPSDDPCRDRIDDQANEPADQRAVDADILQVLSDGQFEPVHQRGAVPSAHHVRDVGADTGATRQHDAAEGIAYLHERDVRSLVARSASSGGDIGKLEATGVQNFLDLDDLLVTEEGEPVDVQSIIKLSVASGRCVLPAFNPSPVDPFLRQVNASGKKWVIVTDLSGEPAFVLDAHDFLRRALFNQCDKEKGAYWHRPIIVRDMQTRLGDVIGQLKVIQERADDDVIDDDLILVWGAQRRIITGSDLLGRLLRGIATVEPAAWAANSPSRREPRDVYPRVSANRP